MDGITNFRNGTNADFGHELVSVGYEIITYINRNPTLKQHEKIERIYNEIIKSLD